MGLTNYPPRGSFWTVDACLRDVRKRILVEIIGGGHGSVSFEHRGHKWQVDVLIWHRSMCPVLKERHK